MTDRELLQLAAKAVGAELLSGRWVALRDDGVWHTWDPLEDDGDALRLAVDQMLQVSVYGEEVFAVSFCGKFQIVEQTGDSPLCATRRAIVRAAAEIGATKET